MRQQSNRAISFWVLLLPLVLTGCESVEPDTAWPVPEGFPALFVPEDNPMTQDKVELGRHLFYDRRLSDNQSQACATCHLPSMAFSDGKARPTGSTGQLLSRNSQGLGNAGYQSVLTWANPVLGSIESQILVPMFGEDPIELGLSGREEAVYQRFDEDLQYQGLLQAAFPKVEAFTTEVVLKSLASFVRSLISGGSRYDEYIRGDRSALNEEEVDGLNIFFSERLECHHCHSGFNFTESTVHDNSDLDESSFHNTGLYNLGENGAYPAGAQGLFDVTRDSRDRGRFRTPSLRNVAQTAPYFHDGSAATLSEVIDSYQAGGRHIVSGPNAGDGRLNPNKSPLITGFELSDTEKQNLISFLEALSDSEFLINPKHQDPNGAFR